MFFFRIGMIVQNLFLNFFVFCIFSNPLTAKSINKGQIYTSNLIPNFSLVIMIDLKKEFLFAVFVL